MLSPSTRVRRSAELIATNPLSDVKVDTAACEEAAQFISRILNDQPHTYQYVSASWLGSGGLHPTTQTSQTLQWIFVVDTLNFCFWSKTECEPFTVKYKCKQYTGYWALCAAINRALDDGIPITDPSYYSQVDLETASHIFRSETSTVIPLLRQRITVLNEAGKVLVQKFRGSVQYLISQAHSSSQKLVDLVVTNFKSYDDSVPLSNYPFHAQSINVADELSSLCFYKRAQILVADIWACFASTDLYRFHDISQLTMFADYRVPQILNWLGAIKYSDKLIQALKLGEEFSSGDKREIEIRACSIHAVELIRRKLELLMKPNAKNTADEVPINSVLVDFALWDYAKAHKEELKETPIHLVKSIFY